MNDIVNILKNKDNFVILTHINPDGDAIGSSLSMYNILNELNKNVDIIIKEVPNKFSYLEGFSDIKTNSFKKYDYAIVVDTATKERINSCEVLENANIVVNIDHHISNKKYGDINYVKEYPACSQIIYELFKELNIDDKKSILEPIANGIITDTGGLSHNDVLVSTYKTIYELSNLIDIPYIFKNTINKVTKSEFELKRITMNNLKMLKDNKIAYSYITNKDIIDSDGTYYDTSTLVNTIRGIEGVYVTIFTKFLEDSILISLRSNFIDVNIIASKFNGGGHILASGINLDKNINYDNFLDELIEETEKSIDEWDNSSK